MARVGVLEERYRKGGGNISSVYVLLQVRIRPLDRMVRMIEGPGCTYHRGQAPYHGPRARQSPGHSHYHPIPVSLSLDLYSDSSKPLYIVQYLSI